MIKNSKRTHKLVQKFKKLLIYVYLLNIIIFLWLIGLGLYIFKTEHVVLTSVGISIILASILTIYLKIELNNYNKLDMLLYRFNQAEGVSKLIEVFKIMIHTYFNHKDVNNKMFGKDKDNG